MKICGIEIKGSEAIFAVVTLNNNLPEHQPLSTRKIALEDDDEASNVKAFATLVEGFVRDNGIEHLAIKKRSKKGEFAGGPTTFKIEGVLQLLSQCSVVLVSPQTVSAQYKKHDFALGTSLTKYQHEAYKTACSVLMKKA
ncbi:MAG: DUF3010 family protein [Pseudomonas sp.]